MEPEDAQKQLQILRPYRTVKSKDLSLKYMKDKFKYDVENPYKQLGQLSALWRELMPPHLIKRTRLVGLSRGVLHIQVDSAPAHYEISQRLRAGIKRELITRHKGPAIKKVQIKVGFSKESTAVDPRRLPLQEDVEDQITPEEQQSRWHTLRERDTE